MGEMRAVWATFFPSISSAFLLAAARHRRQEEEVLPASSVETRSTETAAAAADEDPSSSSSFSFSRDHLDGRFLFSYSKALRSIGGLSKSEVLNQREIKRIRSVDDRAEFRRICRIACEQIID